MSTNFVVMGDKRDNNFRGPSRYRLLDPTETGIDGASFLAAATVSSRALYVEGFTQFNVQFFTTNTIGDVALSVSALPAVWPQIATSIAGVFPPVFTTAGGVVLNVTHTVGFGLALFVSSAAAGTSSRFGFTRFITYRLENLGGVSTTITSWVEATGEGG